MLIKNSWCISECAPCGPAAFWALKDDIDPEVGLVVTRYADVALRDELGQTMLHKVVLRKPDKVGGLPGNWVMWGVCQLAIVGWSVKNQNVGRTIWVFYQIGVGCTWEKDTVGDSGQALLEFEPVRVSHLLSNVLITDNSFFAVA